MSERYTRLFALEENLYSEGSPIVISAGALLKDNRTGAVLAQLKIKNISRKVIKAAIVCLTAYDAFGKIIDGTVEKKYLDLAVERDAEFGQKVLIPLPDAAARAFTATVTCVGFADNTIWNYAGEEQTALPHPKLLAETLGESELVKQYQIKYGVRAKVFPEAYKDVWFCACGALCRADEGLCHTCGNKRSELLSFDREALTAEKDERLEKEAEEHRKAAEEAERLRREEAERAAERRKKRKKAEKITLIVLASLVAVAALAVASKLYFIPQIKYSKAEKALEAQSFDDAYSTFTELGDYKDSADKAKETIYRKALFLMDSGDYMEAVSEFNKVLSEYPDGKDMKNECQYLYGEQLIEEKKYDEAYTVFRTISSYKDSRVRANEAKYLYAVACFDAGDYENAYDAFFLAKSHEGAFEKYQEAAYLYAAERAENSDWKKASALYKELKDYKDSQEKFTETCYQYGLEQLSSKSYKAAVDAFSALGDYQESKTKLIEAKYGYVETHKSNSDSVTYSYLKDLTAINYKDSKEIYKTLYAWSVKLICFNTDPDDYKTIQSSVSRRCSYLHYAFELHGGPLREPITLTNRVYWPNGSVVYSDWDWKDVVRGDGFGAEWPEGLDDNTARGDMVVKIYNKATGECIGEATIKLT